MSGGLFRRLPVSVALALCLSSCGQMNLRQESSGPPGRDVLEAPGIAVTKPSTRPAPSMPAQRRPAAATTTTEDEVLVDVWERIRGQLSWDTGQHARIATEFRWFEHNVDFITSASERAEPYLFYIIEEIERRGLPAELALLPVIESAFKAKAYSRSGASGLWQFISSTGRRFGLQQDWWYDERRDFVKATHAALDYLTELNLRFEGDWLLSLAAYNCGEMCVERAITRQGGRAEFWSLRLPDETERYVPQLLALARIIADPATHDVQLFPIANAPYFETLDTAGPLELVRLAEAAGIDAALLDHMNANYRRGVAGPDGPYHVYVPLASIGPVELALQDLPRSARVRMDNYRIEPGDTLSGIALRFDTSVRALQDANGLQGSFIRAGQELVIPPAIGPATSPALADATVVANAATTTAVFVTGVQEPFTHRVRPGDTLWEIARRHGVSVAELAGWNGIRPESTLSIAQELVINVDAASAAGSSRELDYEIRQGDSFWSISRQFRVKLADLMRWNPGQDPDRLRPGDRVRVILAPDV